ncbi:hypothetical protein NUW58_g1862 [Xylaria curta]|uniref:Uncharacterized protein n=1 Tax=Xylaria curta TaxID=42375 RepID=A0ACC1PKC2_9PEZI|nr:hypothetical protein NUW58_g1862 [Xylaria curta]
MRDNRGDFVRVENSTDNLTMNVPRVSSKKLTFNWNSWWWWEIMAIVLSIASTVGLVVLLAKIDNTPRRSWSLLIQPNSFIAVLTTISKAALLVPAASSLSQLKWRHFESAPRKLADLQLFDGASRGPWGSLIFLFRISNHLKALIAVGFSLLTILSLGLDIFTQQLLAFPIRETEITDASVVMGAATGYLSKSTNLQFREQALNPKIIPLQYEILNSLRGSTFNSYFDCPQNASRCTWDSLTTMGVCSSWNSAPVTSDGCNITTAQAPGGSSNATYAACNYTLSNPKPGNPNLAAAIYPVRHSLSFRIPSVDFNSGNKVFESEFIPGFYTIRNEVGEFRALRALGSTNFSSQASFEPPEAEALFASFWWCSRRYLSLTAEPSGVTYASESSEPLHYLFNTSIDTAVPYGYSYTYTANSTGLNYTLEGGTYESLTMYLRSLLMSTAVDRALGLAGGSVLTTGELLYEQDLENMTKSVADSLTNIMRSRALDENFNITDVAGKSFYNETYIEVRWIWLLLPVTETVLITFLFLLSVAIMSKQPLLKDSVLAYLATAVKDDSGKTSDFGLMQWSSQKDLDDLVEDIIVKLESNEQGWMSFSRKDI